MLAKSIKFQNLEYPSSSQYTQLCIQSIVRLKKGMGTTIVPNQSKRGQEGNNAEIIINAFRRKSN